MTHQVFISYSFDDKEAADRICGALETESIACWMAPRDILPGVEWAEGIIEAIDAARILLLVLTESSNNSPQVVREVERAVGGRTPILTVRLENAPLTKSMSYFLGTHHWFDAVAPPLDDHLPRLVDAVRHGLERTSEGPSYVPDLSGPGVSGRNEAASREVDEERLLSSLSEEEFGGGLELTATSFLIFGLLTFWIYTVWVYHRLLRRHARWRSEYFSRLVPEDRLDPDAAHVFQDLSQKAFAISSGTKFAVTGLYLVSLILMVGELVAQHLFAFSLTTEKFFNTYTLIATPAAVLLFCAASVWFLSWVYSYLKRHEYHELLVSEFAEDPAGFKMVRPSDSFLKRWTRRQNLIALFLVLSVPMIVSPAVGVFHVFSVMNAGGDFITYIYYWSALIFALAAVFHLWGTKLLIDMYNFHISTESRQRLALERRF